MQTETFTVLAVCAWFNSLNCRSEVRSAMAGGVLRNPWLIGGLLVGNLLQLAVIYWAPLAKVFHTRPIAFHEAVGLAVVGSLVFWVEELRKLIVRIRLRRADAA